MNRFQRFLAVSVILLAALSVGLRANAAAPEEVRSRYAGSFVIESRNDASYYWYVHPTTLERYAINSSSEFSRFLRNLGTGVRNRDLARIATATSTTAAVDYSLANRFRGDILLQVEELGQAWYVNPLDGRRYFLPNGEKGFQVAKDLALDIRDDRLEQIPVTKQLGFDHLNYTFGKSKEAYNREIYDTVFNVLRTDHLHKDRFTDEDLFYGSLKGMAQGTGDSYTEFYTPTQNQAQRQTLEGDQSIEGIGAVIDARNNAIIVASVIDGTPAERAGLKAQDQILAVDGQSTEGMSLQAAVSRIRGVRGTDVRLMIYRQSNGSTSDFTIKRDRIEFPTVQSKILDSTVAYIRVNLFTTDLIPLFQKAVDTLITPQTTGVIIDMRDNIGGITQSAVNLADFWVKPGALIMTERRPSLDVEYVASARNKMPGVPTAILVNGETASASEIFTLAVQHYGNAKAVGVRSYGKGTGQNLVSFEDGSGLKYTTFEWLPPDGMSVEKRGITPDIVVTQSDYGDAQLERAKQFIRYGF